MPQKGVIMILPDTNIFINALFNKEPDASFLKQQLEKGKVVISVIVAAEFYSKVDQPEQEVFEELLASCKIIEIDLKIAKTAGAYRKEFLRKTSKVFLQDCFLAAQAKVHNLTIVTNNKADFPMKNIKVISP